MPRFRVRTTMFVAIAVVAACNRTEEPQSTAGARPPPPRTAPPAPPVAEPALAPQSSEQRCPFPMPEQPAPAASPAQSCPPDPHGRPDLPRGHITFLDAPSRPRIDVELARTPEHRERGLMFRTEMPRDEGMLFSWDDERVRSFWMKNTCIPLDMLFIAADATIVGILEQVPVLNTASRSVPCPAMHVLELNAGWARAHGIAPGQKLRIGA